MEQRLSGIFANVNYWLKFAEAKNAALFAATSAMFFGIISLAQGFTNLPSELIAYLVVCEIFLVVSAAFTLLSFIPRVKIPFITKLEKPVDDDNLLFYGDIAKYDAEAYLKKLVETNLDDTSKLERDYADQIIINSRITLWKYRYFNIAMWLTLSVIATPIMSLIAFLFFRNGKRGVS